MASASPLCCFAASRYQRTHMVLTVLKSLPSVCAKYQFPSSYWALALPA